MKFQKKYILWIKKKKKLFNVKSVAMHDAWSTDVNVSLLVNLLPYQNLFHTNINLQITQISLINGKCQQTIWGIIQVYVHILHDMLNKLKLRISVWTNKYVS